MVIGLGISAMDWNVLFLVMADIGTTKIFVVGTENILVSSRGRQSDGVVMEGLGCEVEHADKVIISVATVADKGDNGVVSVFEVKPLKAGIVEIIFPECWVVLVKPVHLKHKI